MTNTSDKPFLPGYFSQQIRPLARYLPHLPDGVIAAWLHEAHISPESWLLDPFGAAPLIAIEAARSGCNILVAVNNPIIRFILELMAQPPQIADLNAALATLASARLRDERIEPHMRALYTSECQGCGRAIMVDAFLWEKGQDTPYGRIYTCPHCNDAGERAATPKDREHAKKFGGGGFHRVRALERVAPLHDPDRAFVEEALDTYPGRAIYVLSTLINKLDGLPLSSEQQRHFAALLLVAFDQANALWPHDQTNHRPTQLSMPAKYRENNIWLALENAVALWATDAVPIAISHWPEIPSAPGGICIYDGRVKDLVKDLVNELGKLDTAAVITAIPSPNQAYWSLSALWAGWLWGAEAVEDFKAVLRHQNLPWRWHTSALHNILEILAGNLKEQTPIFGLIDDANPDFLSTALSAANMAGLDLDGLAMRTEQGQFQFRWRTKKSKPVMQEPETGFSQNAMQAGAKAYLRARGEPASYIPLLSAGLQAYMRADPFDDCPTPDQAFPKIQKNIGESFSYRGGFLRLDATAQVHQSGYWWLEDFDKNILPLSDRVEMLLVRTLIKLPNSTMQTLDTAVCAAFPGLLTPSSALIHACLHAYGQQNPDDGTWQIRADDLPTARRTDLSTMGALITKLGNYLGFKTEADDHRTYQWIDSTQQTRYTIYLTASALLGKILASQHEAGSKPVIVMPGGRANLVSYKLDHNPYLRQQVESGWQLIKYRHLRHLAENSTLSLANFDAQLGLDPFEKQDPQLRLF